MANSFPILLVDDDPDTVDVLRRAAQSSFMEATFTHVSTFEQAERYIEDLEGKGPKLVLLDIDLNDNVNGLDFLIMLRAHPKGRTLPVVMLSGNKASHVVKRAYNNGASSFTVKPFGYTDWKEYLSQLKTYWLETVTLLDVRHKKED